jgi:maltooligosyltrehalose trehalohydrolase
VAPYAGGIALRLGPDLGASYLGDGKCTFCVWAPLFDHVELHIIAPEDKLVRLEKGPRGYHSRVVTDIVPGALYRYRLGSEKEFPDPASRFQPDGVHGPSQVVDRDFPWKPGSWRGIPLRDYILYELHIGAYTPEKTFEAVIPRLGDLKSLGITALELMPVAQFPGARNWGYDGAFPFAVQNSYGGPEGLKRLVDACHGIGLAVVLDVVYNHLGPEGNYFAQFGPYFTSRYQTPWGDAINFDGPHSDEVRRYFIENALYWIGEFRIDALRLDAVHGIFDFSAKKFVEQLAAEVHAQADASNRRVYLIAECDRNDAGLTRSHEMGGLGLDAQWNDDFHHALHTLLTVERAGYYQDFGRLDQMAKAFGEGFVYSGDYSIFRSRSHGGSSHLTKGEQFVVCCQNHDQVGNRRLGERLSVLVSLEALKLAAGIVILSPFIPLLFMGEEYGEIAPFPYFVSHSDADLVHSVREGRRKEFSAFDWHGDIPDPQAEETFQSAKLDHALKHAGRHKMLWEFYKELISLRKRVPALSQPDKDNMEVVADMQHNLLVVRRWHMGDEVVEAFHFGSKPASLVLGIPPGRWRSLIDSADPVWEGPGNNMDAELTSDGEMHATIHPHSLVVLRRQMEN